MHNKLIICLLAATLATALSAQVNYSAYPNPEFAQMIDERPWTANLTGCPYELAVQPGPDTKAPKGYKPVYISHYGRHGSRSGWDQKKYESIISALTQAKNAGILSASGDSLLNETVLVQKATNKMDGRLTLRGQREHRGIAERMYRRFPAVFRKGSRSIRVLGSEIPRSLISMAAFTNRLCELDRNLDIVMDCGSELQPILYNSCGKEVRKAREKILDSLRKALNPDLSGMMNLLFTDAEAAKAFVPDAKAFSNAVFAVGRISRSFDFDFNTYRFLPFEAVYGWSDINNMSLYLGQCNSVPFGDVRMKRVRPLADHMVAMADDALSSGSTCADLRFGHDLPLLAISSLLGIEGVGERYTVDEARRHFITTLYAPFAGNLQLIFYRCSKAGAPVLVKVLLNENEVLLKGLDPVQGPYYKWEDIRKRLQ